MGFLSQRVERSDLKAGDHIYTWRAAFAYTHHGIYVGDNKVIHFTGNKISSSYGPSFSSSSDSSTLASKTCPHIPESDDAAALLKREEETQYHGDRSSGGVVLSCLDCFVKYGSPYRYEYGVGKRTLVLKLRGGTCTMAKSDPPETVVHRAKFLFHNGFFKYNLVNNNCEDFALYCKTGRLTIIMKPKGGPAPAGCSGQVSRYTSLGLRGRYGKDIGVREDFIEVSVEDLKTLGFDLQKLFCFSKKSEEENS